MKLSIFNCIKFKKKPISNISESLRIYGLLDMAIKTKKYEK